MGQRNSDFVMDFWSSEHRIMLYVILHNACLALEACTGAKSARFFFLTIRVFSAYLPLQASSLLSKELDQKVLVSAGIRRFLMDNNFGQGWTWE